MGASDSVFNFMEFYIFFFVVLTALCAWGLTSFIAVTNPTLITPTFTTFTIAPVEEGDWGAAIVAVITGIVNVIIWFFENLAFLFSLLFANPFTSAAWLGYLFTFLTTMFGLCIVLVIRG